MATDKTIFKIKESDLPGMAAQSLNKPQPAGLVTETGIHIPAWASPMLITGAFVLMGFFVEFTSTNAASAAEKTAIKADLAHVAQIEPRFKEIETDILESKLDRRDLNSEAVHVNRKLDEMSLKINSSEALLIRMAASMGVQ